MRTPGLAEPGTLPTRTATAMDQLILAAHDVVEAWDNHTEDLEDAINRLADALAARKVRLPRTETETQELSPAGR